MKLTWLEKISQKFFPVGGGSVYSWLYPNDSREKLELLKRYEGYVYACVRPIALAVSKADLYVNRSLVSGKKDIANHSFLDVFNRPNRDWTKNQFLQLTWTHKKVAGEAFWYMVLGDTTNRPKEFHILRPDCMSVSVGKDDNGLPSVTGYVYTQEGGTKVPLDRDEVVHFKEPNPINPWRGLSAVEAGYIYVMTEKYGSEFTRNFIANNAMPAGILNVKGTISDSEFQELKRRWSSEYAGVNNAGKTAFLKNMQVDFVKVGTNLSEIDLKQLKNMTRDDIMAMFGVTKPILGILDDVNLASAKAAHYIFSKQIVDPEVDQLVDTLSPLVKERWGASDELGYKSVVPEDDDQNLKEEETLIYKVFSINDVRRRHGMESVLGGDKLYIPVNLIEAADTTQVEKPSTKELATLTIKKHIQKKKIKSLSYEAKESFRQTVQGSKESYIRLFTSHFHKILDKQEAEVIGNLPGTQKAVSDAFDTDKAISEMQKVLSPVLLDLAVTQGELAIEFTTGGLEGINFTLRQGLIERIKASVQRMAENYNQDTLDQIKAILIEGATENLTVAQLTKRISTEVYGEARGYRSERVARSEVSSASTDATKDAYRQLGVTKIEWFTNPGACQFCDELSGKVIGIEDNFLELGESIDGKDGGSYNIDYDSIDGPPLHPNCTCTTIAVRE